VIRAGIRRAFRLAVRARTGWEHDVEEEIKLHLALRAEQLVAEGTPPDQAFDEAVRRFGPPAESRARLLDAARHREQRMQRTEYFADLRQDLAFALRTLRRQKAWTAVTLATLALGVGATTAVFSVVSSLMLHMLPYPGGDRLGFVYQQPTGGNNTGISVTLTPSTAVFRAWRAGARSFDALEGFTRSEMEMRTSGDPVTLNIGRIDATFPAFAAKRPVVGRMFSEDEATAGGRVALLSEGIWRTRFGADAGMIGKTIMLDDSLYTVIGVLPSSLQWPLIGEPARDVWLPLNLRDDKGGVMLLGRLRPGVDATSAARELDSLAVRSGSRVGGKPAFQTVVMPPSRRLPYRDSLVMLSFAVALVLLIACANVAHLLMARSASRQRELAIRGALGAGHGRIFRQLLTESLLLAVGGTAIGVFVGWIGLEALIALRPPSLATLERAHLDGTTLSIATLVAIVTGVIFGLLGGWQSGRLSANDSLKAGSTRVTGGRARARTLLVVSEMALSATLVVGASMLVRSVINLQHARLGFEPKALYSLTMSASKQRFATASARGELLRTVATRLGSVHDIRSFALTSTPPGWRSFAIGRLEIDGETPPAENETSFVDVNQIGSGFFKTMGIRLVEGTTFTDTTAGANQVIVNAAFARKHWRDASAVGHRLRVAQKGASPWLTIVGVADDAATSGPMSVAEASTPMLYTPAADSVVEAIILRTEGAASPLTPLQALVRSIDPLLVPELHSAEQQMQQSIAAPRFVMLLLTVFTILALMLAAIGLYGVMAYSVAEQTREIGIRVALGATRSRIARAIILRGVAVAVAGSVVGIVAAAWGTKLIEHQLYGVARSDAFSFVAAIVVLLGAAGLACIVPTRRALAVDPMTAIRAD
jgi:Acidobacterial duplicated orphan permease